MKRLHRDDMYGWSVFDERLNIDFHSVLWVHPDGNVVIDPLPLSEHDRIHLEQLGSVSTIVITNSDHTRASKLLAEAAGARILGPAAERAQFEFECDDWLGDGDVVVPGLNVLTLHGSKTPGELALLLEETTLITGDLIRAHEAGKLCLLPDPKLLDKEKAVASLRRCTDLPGIETVLPGDGWPVFRGGGRALAELAAAFD
ncbi:MAG: MBL fold metallo-hydrolase [Gammaproteobacteria bacterium]|nr:MBL fold metallo-hydrolase [Gammaproteobacteria bacterium]